MEERIEVNVEDNLLEDVVTKLKENHPYEESIIDVYKLSDV